jgi:hypothetical protein
MVDSSPTAGILAGLLLVALGWIAWLLIGARRRPFAVVLNGEVISTHRKQEHALKAYAEQIEALELRDSGDTAGLPWAVVAHIGPDRRYAVIDRRQRDRRRRPRPGGAARRLIGTGMRVARQRSVETLDRNDRD